ncbi:MAG TPA: hypothetical protein VK203_23695 [Nostocaceae cyanobacterium]|nr:hypothetical protein [Nostocaceae cyanobacterium]
MSIKVHTLIAIQDMILLVFYTEANCWQFRIISAGGSVFGEKRIYYTPEAAEKAGRDWLGQGN